MENSFNLRSYDKLHDVRVLADAHKRLRIGRRNQKGSCSAETWTPAPVVPFAISPSVAGSILCVCGSLEIVRQFAGVPFRLSENAEQHLPRHQISIADLADESGVNFDLMPL